MAMQLDLCNVMDGAAQLGVVKAGGKSGTGAFDAYPANVLGSQSTTPLALAGAYATFASGGTYCQPIAITSVQDASGAELPIPSANCTQAISPELANAMSFAMSKVWEGTGREIGRPSGYTASGKTGTTSENEYTWFVGYTPRLATAVWVGYPDKFTPMQGVRVNGRYIPNMFGATIAGPTWKRFMDQALADGQANPGFEQPSSESVYGRAIPIPSVVGKDQNTAINELRAAGFSASVGGTTASDITPGSVVSQSPSGSAPAGSSITLTLSSGPGAPAGGDGGGGGGNAGNGGGNPGGGNPGNGNNGG
jgi:membrane peptidoglycan carboxypeptidase